VLQPVAQSLFDRDERIKKIWPQVKPDEHAEEVLAVL